MVRSADLVAALHRLTRGAPSISHGRMKLEERLMRRQLILVMGKGGVGKSVMTAVLGHRLAARGRRTLVLEVDPRKNLHQLLDISPSGGDITRVAERLYLQNLKPLRVVDWIVERQVKIRLLVKRVLRSPIYHRFIGGAPGLTQMAILGHALRLVRGDLTEAAPAIDTVVLDAPATGHGIYLLNAARLVSEAITEGPVFNLAGEVAEFVGDRDKSALVLVTQAEEMPVQEAMELRQALADEFEREPELLVVNGLYPPAPDEVADGDAGDDELTSLWRRRRRVNERELGRLKREWPGPRVELPLLPIDQGPELIRELETRLENGLRRLEEARWT